jgi:hypothetical protein
MRILAIFFIALSMQAFVAAGTAQQDRLEGSWAGTVQGPQGQQQAVATFKKNGAEYAGTISGLRPGMDGVLKDIKLEGDNLSAKAEFETPQATIVVNYKFVLQGEELKGTGEVEFAGQTYSFNYALKRGAELPAGPPAGRQPPRRPEVPQPQQKQSLNYFVGTWSFKWIGRESPLGPAPREGTVTYTLRPDGKALDGRVSGTADGKPYTESAVITFDDQTKMLTFSERLASGIAVQSKGDWHSPISIRFTVDPIKVKGQTLLLRRTISVVAAHSFTVTDELSEDGGPFVRLGNAVYSKVEAVK